MIVQTEHVYCFEQRLANVPESNHWLNADERLHLGTYHVPKRRSDWRLGRWTAKNAVAKYLGWPVERLNEIEIKSVSSGAPVVLLPDGARPPEISISHSWDTAMCAVAPAGTLIGCDIEKVEQRSQSFVETFLADREIEVLKHFTVDQRNILATIMWGAKESYLKATRDGLRRDTRELETIIPLDVSLNSFQDTWRQLWIVDSRREHLGWWRCVNGSVRTLAGINWLPIPLTATTRTHDCRARVRQDSAAQL